MLHDFQSVTDLTDVFWGFQKVLKRKIGVKCAKKPIKRL